MHKTPAKLGGPSLRLYEILIPVADNEGRKFTTRHHRQWESIVRDMAGGLSVCPALMGQWVDNGRVYREKMRPVRVACRVSIIRRLALLAKRHYRQLSIMYYPVSTVVTFA